MALLTQAQPIAVQAELSWLSLLRVVLVLAGVLVLSYAILRHGLPRFVRPPSTDGYMELVSRFPLEPRRTLYVIRAGSTLVLLGSSESGLSFLARLDGEAQRGEALRRETK